MSLIVYHGTNIEIKHPDCHFGREAVDFGQGFYVTDVKEQATEWARRIADNRGGSPIINRYTLLREELFKVASAKLFTSYNEEWLNFVVRNRQLKTVEKYDYIEGGVANDRVIDSIRLYMLGLLTVDVTLQKLQMQKTNKQICLRSQELTDKYLIFDGTEEI